jgi:hypothetical protein
MTNIPWGDLVLIRAYDILSAQDNKPALAFLSGLKRITVEGDTLALFVQADLVPYWPQVCLAINNAIMAASMQTPGPEIAATWAFAYVGDD